MKTGFSTIATLFLLSSGLGFAADWRPVDPTELAQKTPRIDPAADAEAIFWDIRIEDKLNGSDLQLTLNHYIRIKIFTDRGKEKYSTIEIPRFGKRGIIDVAGRTIKADGTVIDLKKEGIFDRELVKTKGLKMHGKTFTLPNVAAGDIIEYRYKEVRDKEVVSHMRLYFQRELPMWLVTYHVKPLQIPYLPYRMRSMSFQCNLPPVEQEPQGFYLLSMKDMPAFEEEAYMPPEDQLRAWVLIYYEEDKKLDAEKYWKEIGKHDFGESKSHMKADGNVKQTAAELTEKIEKPEDKLAALEMYCRTKIRNLNSRAFHMTSEEREAVKDNHSPGDTLKQKAGYGSDVNLLFASMANAIGFDARMARGSDRSDTFFDKRRPSTYFLNTSSVAVKLNDKWVFFDPATPYLEHGMLRWQEEGTTALVSDPKEAIFTTTQYTEPSRSMRRRKGTFKLLEDGTLDGYVQYTYTGHVAQAEKSRFEDMTPAQQEEHWKESLQNRLSTAELSEFAVQDAAEAAKPLVVRHKLTVPGYATRTGKRILLQPAFFEHNAAPRFTDSKRKWDIYFDYAWAEEDEVEIDLPEGWNLDQPVNPQNSNLGAVGSYTTEVQKTVDGKKLIYRRHFDWGRKNALLISASNYLMVKKVFDFIQEQDDYTIALRPVANAH